MSWANAPPGPNGWRNGGGVAGGSFAGYRGGIPNGRHLPTNPDYPARFGARPGSAHGESRDRRRERRDRDRDDERELEEEVISTIFVVGFPDDMSEREFQNIFTFAPGFEAATLKFPSGSRREPTAALLAELTQLAAHQNAQGGEYSEYPLGNINLEEAISSLSLTTASTSQSTTPSAPMSLTPSVSSNPMLAPGPNPAIPPSSARRQTIGFARFKTRSDALTAKDHLQGKKIDPLTGSVLKAEMAKKNLHTKKTTSGEEIMGFLLRSGRLGLVPGAGHTTGPVSVSGTSGGNGAMGSVRDAWESWPNSSSGPGSDKDARLNVDEKATANMSSQLNTSTNLTPSSASAPTSTSAPGVSTSTSPPLRQTDSKALLALAEEADELEGWSVNGALGMGMTMGPPYEGYSSVSAPSQGQAPGQGQGQRRLGSQSGPAGAAYGRHGHGHGPEYGTNATGTTLSGEHMDGAHVGGIGLAGGRIMGANPADQNPPINTLYVGNLPAVSPPTHPPGFLEESLRALFSRCPGFKRMSYRQKINGPMCFVEFEEVIYASQAIKELYGHNLGGLVKGGIRLSYSKNSLGQRGNNHPSQINTNVFGGIAHNVALAGMSMTSPTTQQHPLPNGAVGYGLPGSLGEGSASLGMGDLRRESGPGTATANGISTGTSLSPTAQPFNISLPPTSPRSRYFASPPLSTSNPHKLSPTESASVSASASASASTSVSAGSSLNSNTTNGLSTTGLPTPGGAGVGVPIPSSSSRSSTSARSTASAFQPFGQPSTSISTSVNTNTSSGFSPVSSPIRTPASFSWLSSSAGTGGGVGYGYEFGGSVPLGSLNGAASAWGQSAERRD